MKPAGDVHDAPKPMKWLRCAPGDGAFPENEFKAHQRLVASPRSELVRSPRDRRPPRTAPVERREHPFRPFVSASRSSKRTRTPLGESPVRAALDAEDRSLLSEAAGFERRPSPAPPRGIPPFFLRLLVSERARVSHAESSPRARIDTAHDPTLSCAGAASPRLFGQQPNRRVVCETSDPDRSRSRSLRRSNAACATSSSSAARRTARRSASAACAVLSPRRTPAAAARAAAQARLAGFNGTREPKLAALRGGANKNGKDSADIVPPHKENAAPSHPVHARRKPPAPDVPARKAVPASNPPRKAPAPAPAPAPDCWRIPTRAST